MSQESPNPPQTAGVLRSLLSRASTSTGVSRPFLLSLRASPRGPCLDIGDPHTCFHPAVLGAPSIPPPLLQPHQPAISALVRAFAQGQSPRWHRPRDRPARVQGPPRRGARGSWEAVGREPACSGRPGLSGDPYLLSRGPSRLAPHQAVGQTDRTRLPRSACRRGPTPAAQAAAFQLSWTRPPTPAAPPIGAWARGGGGAWTPTLGVGVPEKCERAERSAFGCVGAAGGAGGGLPCRSLPGLATQTQALQSPFPPSRSARRTHRRLRTHPTGAFGPGKGLGREAVALLCLPPPLVGLPAAGWHSPVSAIERLIIIILKFFSILCFIFQTCIVETFKHTLKERS